MTRDLDSVLESESLLWLLLLLLLLMLLLLPLMLVLLVSPEEMVSFGVCRPLRRFCCWCPACTLLPFLRLSLEEDRCSDLLRPLRSVPLELRASLLVRVRRMRPPPSLLESEQASGPSDRFSDRRGLL